MAFLASGTTPSAELRLIQKFHSQRWRQLHLEKSPATGLPDHRPQMLAFTNCPLRRCGPHDEVPILVSLLMAGTRRPIDRSARTGGETAPAGSRQVTSAPFDRNGWLHAKSRSRCPVREPKAEWQAGPALHLHLPPLGPSSCEPRREATGSQPNKFPPLN